MAKPRRLTAYGELKKRLRQELDALGLTLYVSGVGVGKDDGGRIELRIYLREKPPTALPKRFEGHKVISTVTGEIRAAAIKVDELVAPAASVRLLSIHSQSTSVPGASSRKSYSPIVLTELLITGSNSRKVVCKARIDIVKRMFIDYPDDPLAAAKMRVCAALLADVIIRKLYP